jgi:SAM-dependent methyltransferase
MSASLPQIFNRELYLARQKKASTAQAPLLAHVAEDLLDRLSVINHSFDSALIIAASPEPFRAALQASAKFKHIATATPVHDDLALAPLSHDAIFHVLDLQCVNDVPGTLAQCARALRPDGLFMAAAFAGETLIELRNAWAAAESEIVGQISPRVAPMIGTREMGGLLQRAGLALPVADGDRLTLRYGDALALLREIKAFGFANPLAERRTTFTSRRILSAVMQRYHLDNADDDGRVRATLDLLWALAWKPHESQPKPKQPGSATMRLEDALKKLDNES